MAAGLGTMNSPNITKNLRFRTFMNQSLATSGKTPRRSTLDQLIEDELSSQRKDMQDRARLAEASRQFDISQQNAVDTASANRTAGYVQAAGQLGATYLGGKALGLWGKTSPATTPPPIVSGGEGALTPEAAQSFTAKEALGLGNAETLPPPSTGGGIPAPAAEVGTESALAGETTLSPATGVAAGATGAKIIGQRYAIPAGQVAAMETMGGLGSTPTTATYMGTTTATAPTSAFGKAVPYLAYYSLARGFGQYAKNQDWKGQDWWKRAGTPAMAPAGMTAEHISKATGINEINQVGRFLESGEETVVGTVEDAIGSVFSALGGLF